MVAVQFAVRVRFAHDVREQLIKRQSHWVICRHVTVAEA
jgi:hypothetical protein